MIDQKKVPEELAKRADEYLIDRARHYCRTGWWTAEHWRAFAASGVHVRDEQLYSIAAEVATNAKNVAKAE